MRVTTDDRARGRVDLMDLMTPSEGVWRDEDENRRTSSRTRIVGLVREFSSV